MNKGTFYLLAKMFGLSLLILFFVSPDSYTHDTFEQYDTAWFFTCGKAWMSGMTPYVDFADSKGPLLWLIYGVGYLISPYNYIGLFWLSVFLYTIIFYYVYLTANLFLKNDKASLFVTICMTLSFFCPWFHHEIRAEDWCQLFIVLTVYYCCRWLYFEDTQSHKKCYTACFILGISLAGTLLIKYSITVMLGFTACYMLFAILKQRENILYSFLSFLSGFVLMTAPFAIYMLNMGILDAFIQEYFLNTLQTIDSYNNSGTYLHEWLMLTYKPHVLIIFMLCCIGAYMMSKMVERYKYFFLISFIGFFAISIHHFLFYYLSSCLLFPLFLVIPVVARRKQDLRFSPVVVTLIICVVIFVNAFNQGFVYDSWFFKNSTVRRDYYNVAYIMSGVKNPTLVNYFSSEHGMGVPVGVLPGTKYWATQMGVTPEMEKDQENAVRNQKADFVVVCALFPDAEKYKIIRSSGYVLVYEYSCYGDHHMLFTKHRNLPLPPADFQVNKMDILLKRNIFMN